ncbi:hypothetical protein JXA32_03750 [Candidatus Sumerlaeota bacterium]|nr:hypothetical protein [Candidatus Sumerlaeota bacterium]
MAQIERQGTEENRRKSDENTEYIILLTDFSSDAMITGLDAGELNMHIFYE